MGALLVGKVKWARAVDVTSHKDGTVSTLLTWTVIDDNGTSWPCQMWPDDPQHADLLSLIAQMHRQTIQCEMVSYSVRLRKDTNQPQVNFIASQVQFLTPAAHNGATPVAQPVSR
jgi:hypothetical protein